MVNSLEKNGTTSGHIIDPCGTSKFFPSSILTKFFSFSQVKLTGIYPSTICEWISSVLLRAAADWHMISNFAISVNSTLTSARVYTLIISTCTMCWAFGVICK